MYTWYMILLRSDTPQWIYTIQIPSLAGTFGESYSRRLVGVFVRNLSSSSWLFCLLILNKNCFKLQHSWAKHPVSRMNFLGKGRASEACKRLSTTPLNPLRQVVNSSEGLVLGTVSFTRTECETLALNPWRNHLLFTESNLVVCFRITVQIQQHLITVIQLMIQVIQLTIKTCQLKVKLVQLIIIKVYHLMIKVCQLLITFLFVCLLVFK